MKRLGISIITVALCGACGTVLDRPWMADWSPAAKAAYMTGPGH